MPGVTATDLNYPLTFAPVYQNVVWGGRRMEAWRQDLPEGPIGESWEICQQQRGTSQVRHGPMQGLGLDQLMAEAGEELVGAGFSAEAFPLLIKVLDANDRLSVQVHPDDDLAREFDVGRWGKTECWYMIGDGGELFQGVAAGVDAEAFATALKEDRVAESINRFETKDGDFFFMPARTVHALGTGCLLFEIQQNCDCTFRVYDWGRVGLDGKPRQLHIEESLQTINFNDGQSGPLTVQAEDLAGGQYRQLVDCPFFTVSEYSGTGPFTGGDTARCSIIMAVDGQLEVQAGAGSQALAPMSTALVPAAAGAWTVKAAQGEALRFLVARPVF